MTHPRPLRAAARGARACALLATALLAACGGARAAPAGEPAALPPASAIARMNLSGQRVLVLPVQAAAGVEGGRDRATAEVVFALRERDSRTPWVDPDALRASLRRSPGYAPDPGTVSGGMVQQHGERRVVEPLASLLRRYGALANARLVLLLRDARFLPVSGDEDAGVVRIQAEMVDSRTGLVVWFGAADGALLPRGDAGLLPSAAAALASRMVMGDSP
jgi:hypothetical protein